MSQQFHVGEIAICQNAERLPFLNGEECVIVEADVLVTTLSGMAQGYRIAFQSGFIGCAAPWQLRRRKPPTTGEESVLAMFKRTPQREGAPA